MTKMMAKTWLDAMKAEGYDIEQNETDALNEAILALDRMVATEAVKNSKGDLFCPLCLTKMGRDNNDELARFCLYCGKRLVVDFKGRNSDGEIRKGGSNDK